MRTRWRSAIPLRARRRHLDGDPTYGQNEVAISVLVSELLNVIGSMAEEEDLIIADLLCNLDRRAVHGSEQKTSVESELVCARKKR